MELWQWPVTLLQAAVLLIPVLVSLMYRCIEDENGCSDLVIKNDTILISSPTRIYSNRSHMSGDSAQFINTSSDNSLSWCMEFWR